MDKEAKSKIKKAIVELVNEFITDAQITIKPKTNAFNSKVDIVIQYWQAV